jgi:hypothetical protein
LINILGHCRAYDMAHQGRGRINGRERPVVRNRRIAVQQQLYVSYDTNLLVGFVPQFTGVTAKEELPVVPHYLGRPGATDDLTSIRLGPAD